MRGDWHGDPRGGLTRPDAGRGAALLARRGPARGGHGGAEAGTPARAGIERRSALYGLFNFGASFGLIYYGFVHGHAGFGQTLLALVGVALMSRAPLREAVPLSSLLAVLGDALCFAQAAVLVRRFARVHAVTMNAVGMTTGGLFLVAGSVLLGEPLVLPRRPETWVAIGYLVAVGSVFVFVLYLVVLRYWAASHAAYTFVLVPFVTVVLSAWLDDEPLSAGLVLGRLLILAGVYVGALRPTRRPLTQPGSSQGDLTGRLRAAHPTTQPADATATACQRTRQALVVSPGR
ncbi:MAG: DMT family transporter [Nitriliruptorales bacterium]